MIRGDKGHSSASITAAKARIIAERASSPEASRAPARKEARPHERLAAGGEEGLAHRDLCASPTSIDVKHRRRIEGRAPIAPRAGKTRGGKVRRGARAQGVPRAVSARESGRSRVRKAARLCAQRRDAAPAD